MKNNPHFLTDILDAARSSKASGKPFKAIFDLDSTLFDVSPRIAKILNSFADVEEIKQKFSTEAAILSKIQPSPTDYGVKRTLARSGFTMDQTTDEFIQILVAYWKKNFFGNEFLQYDVPYPGAQKYVLELEKAGAEILYLTGRDIPRMLEGTIASLKNYGFPLTKNNSNLVLKPSALMRDHDFKKVFFEEMEKAPGEIWFFENEPTNIYLVLETSPHVKVVFVDTVHSEAVPAPTEEIPRISGFEVI